MVKRDELDKIFENVDEPVRKFISDQLDDFVFLSNKIDELKKLPFLIVSKNNPRKQKATPAFREYKELKSQYNDVFKFLIKIIAMTSSEDEDPVKMWIDEYMKEKGKDKGDIS